MAMARDSFFARQAEPGSPPWARHGRSGFGYQPRPDQPRPPGGQGDGPSGPDDRTAGRATGQQGRRTAGQVTAQRAGAGWASGRAEAAGPPGLSGGLDQRATVAHREHQPQDGDPDQQRAGDVDPDQSGRQAGEVLGVADSTLRADQAEHEPAQPHHPRRCPGRVQPHHQRHGEPGQQPADVGVELGDALQRQVVAGDITGARERAGAGDHGPGGEHHRRHRHHAVGRAGAGPAGPATAPARCPRCT